MTVYIELVLLENFAVDYFILMLSSKLIKTKVKRPALGAMIGAVYAGIMPLFGFLSSPIAKTGIYCIMIFASFFKAKMLSLLQAALAGAVTGAMLYGLVYLCASDRLSSGMFYSDDVIFLIALLSVLFAFAACKIFKPFFRQSELNGFSATLSINGKALSALIDTGNSLQYNGLPVVLVKKDALPDINIVPLVIPYDSLGAKGALLGFRPENVSIEYNDKTLRPECVIALCDRDFGGSFNALLSPDIIKECV